MLNLYNSIYINMPPRRTTPIRLFPTILVAIFKAPPIITPCLDSVTSTPYFFCTSKPGPTPDQQFLEQFEHFKVNISICQKKINT